MQQMQHRVHTFDVMQCAPSVWRLPKHVTMLPSAFTTASAIAGMREEQRREGERERRGGGG